MTKPLGPFLGNVHLDDGVHAKFKWTEEKGIHNPAPRASGSVKETFGGPYRINPNPNVQPQKEFDITGYLVNFNGQEEGYNRLRRMYELSALTAGSASRYQIGSLFVKLFPNAPEIPEFKSHSKLLYYAMTGTAVPGTWQRIYGQKATTRVTYTTVNATKQDDFGVVISKDVPGAFFDSFPNGVPRRIFNTSFIVGTSARLEIHNPGDVACPLVATIEISGRTTPYYIRVMGFNYNKRIVVTPEQGGITVVTLKEGLWIPPKSAILRFEEASGALISSAVYVYYYGTKFNFSGLTSQFGQDYAQEWPVLYNSRPGRAYYDFGTNLANITKYAEANEPRIGTETGATTKFGHMLESDGTNVCLYSEDFSNVAWVKTDCTVTTNQADPTYMSYTASNNADQIATNAGATNATCRQNITGPGANSTWTFSIYIRGTSGSGNIEIALGSTEGSTIANCSYTTNWQRFSVTHSYGAVVTTPFCQIGGNNSFFDVESIRVWGAQVENAPYRSSYIPTVANSRTRNGDILAMIQPEHNLLSWSNRFDKTTAVQGTRGLWYITGTMSASRGIGPNANVFDAWQWTGTAGAGAIIEQAIPNAEMITNRTAIFSVWIKSTAAGTSGYNVELRIMDGGTAVATRTVTVFQEWNRYQVAVSLTQPFINYDVRVQIREGVGGSRVFQLFGAQVTYSDGILGTFAESSLLLGSAGSLNEAHVNPYLDTKSTPVYPDNGMSFPWFMTQNGYIQFDARMTWVPGSGNSPNASNHLVLASGYDSDWVYRGWRIFRSSANTAANHTMRAQMVSQNEFNPSTPSTNEATCLPAATVFDGEFNTYRLEWQNYVLNGTRTIRFRLIITRAASGLTVEGAWVNATSGTTKWSWGYIFDPQDIITDHNFTPGPPSGRMVYGTGLTNQNPICYLINPAEGVPYNLALRNLSMGALEVPSGAVPEPY